jgi:isopentenyl-diphosphate delta-isomerase
MSDEAVDRSVAGRKLDHLRVLADDPGVERSQSGFDGINLTHRALPELHLDEIDPSVDFLGKPMRFPLLISSMTGGSGDAILKINQTLAEAAEACGVAMAVGSQRVMFANPVAGQSFDLRKFAPTAPLIGNIGAVQLRAGLTAQHCQEAVDVLQADGLYLHLNPLQEAVQPEGDRDFSGLAAAISDLVPQMSVPLLFKEVGSGLSAADIRLGLKAGVRHFDVAGRGGTSWSRIEYHRRADDADDLGLVFQDWGLTTVEALQEAQSVLPKEAVLIASGGIRNGIDMAKAIILGADVCGLAAPLLSAARQSTEATIDVICRLEREFRTAMFLLGCANCAALKNNTGLLR